MRGRAERAWACPARAYAVALIKVLQGLGGAISTTAKMTTGQVEGKGGDAHGGSSTRGEVLMTSRISFEEVGKEGATGSDEVDLIYELTGLARCFAAAELPERVN